MNDDEIGPRFPSVSDAYDGELQEIAVKCAKKLGIEVWKALHLCHQLNVMASCYHALMPYIFPLNVTYCNKVNCVTSLPIGLCSPRWLLLLCVWTSLWEHGRKQISSVRGWRFCWNGEVDRLLEYWVFKWLQKYFCKNSFCPILFLINTFLVNSSWSDCCQTLWNENSWTFTHYQ